VGRLAYRFEEFKDLDTEIFPILVDTMKNAKLMEKNYAKEKFPVYFDTKNTVAKIL